MDEAIAYLEENGISFTDAQKEDIRQKTAGLAATARTRELTQEDLEVAAGGWSWDNFFAVGGATGVVGGLVGVGVAVALASGPIGWVTLAATGAGTGLVTGALLGTTAAVAEDLPAPGGN